MRIPDYWHITYFQHEDISKAEYYTNMINTQR